MSNQRPDKPEPQVQRVSRAYFEAEFGPIDGPREHTAEIAPMREGTPAFLVFPQLTDEPAPFDDGPEVTLNLRPFDPPPEAA